MISLRPKKKKLLDSQTFFKKQLFIFSFILRLGTFLDIWVCLANQNGGGKLPEVSKMQV